MPPPPTAERCEQSVRQCLQEIRVQFQQALESTDETGHIFTALGTELHVDQVRRIVTESTGAPGRWVMLDGKHTMSTTSAIDQGALSLYIGGNRFVTAELIFLILCDIVEGRRPRGAPNVPGFINLLVAEAYLHPERELLIWVTAARALETGDDRKDLHRILPPLNSDFDVMHHELPANVDSSYQLHPTVKSWSGSWASYELHLLTTVRPSFATLDALVDDDRARQVIYSPSIGALDRYVRQQVFARVAQAIEIADGRRAVLHPPED
jgi:hypothetical protein